jgi:microcystin-dependent protein
MSTPYIGQIKIFAGNFAPNGWVFCDGRLLPIAENDALFALIGTTYGGDGQVTFGVPDLRGRLALNQGQGAGLSNYLIGQALGSETVTLTQNQLPAHSHSVLGNNATVGTVPNGATWALNSAILGYGTSAALQSMNPASVIASGGNQPHSNIMPYLAVNFILSLFGIFPPQS